VASRIQLSIGMPKTAVWSVANFKGASMAYLPCDLQRLPLPFDGSHSGENFATAIRAI
jgi:hypothetical protein